MNKFIMDWFTSAHCQTQRKSALQLPMNYLSAREVKIPGSWHQLLKPFQQSKISGDLIDGHLFITGTVGVLPVAAEHRKERLDESQHL